MESEHESPKGKGTQSSPQTPIASILRGRNISGRPKVRHIFTRASIWRGEKSRRYAAYDSLRHAFVDSTTPYMNPANPLASAQESQIVMYGNQFWIPRRGFSSFPPDWMRIHPLSIYVDYKEDIFYFSTGEFPFRRKHHSLDIAQRLTLNVVPHLRRLTLNMIPRLGLRQKLVTFNQNWEWHEHIEKVAISAPTTGSRPFRFRLHSADRVAISRLPKLQRLYLVIPRDPECHHGPHRDWPHARLNEDGFMIYQDFVALHTALQNSPVGDKECKCHLTPDPTGGELERLRGIFYHCEIPPNIVVVVEDIFQ